jgi:hypothetical protein
MYSLALIIFVVSEKKAFEHVPIGFNVNLCPAMAAILDFRLVFCSDMKFKMAATAGLSLTLDPMGKMFQNASSLKPNCPGILRWRPSWISDWHKKQKLGNGHSISFREEDL